MKLNYRNTSLLRKFLFPIFVLSLFLLITFESCKSPTAPKPNNPQDTTSSNFTWQVDTIGAEGSVLYDVAIINDTLAYAVGELFPRDSTGKSNLGDLYNAALWNGKTWTLIKIPYNYQGTPVYNPIHTVFALSSTDIYFGGNGLEHWDGQQFSNIDAVNPLWSGHLMQKIWASSDNNIYIVGDNGTVAYYDGNWQSVVTGTTLPFQDIWGDGGQVLAVASSHNYADRQLFSLDGNNATAISDSGLYYVFGGIWFVTNNKYYVVGDGVFEKSSLQSPSWYRYPLGEVASDYSDAIRGSSLNDIVIAGDFADISHFNGSSWHEYKELYNPLDQLLSVAIKGNIIIAVGNRYYDDIHNYGIIYLGRR